MPFHLKRIGEATSGPISKLAATGLTEGSGASRSAVTVMRNGDGNLQIIVWDIEDDGTPTFKSTLTEGPAIEVAVTGFDASLFVVAFRGEDNRLRLISYELSASGAKLTRLGTATGDKITRLAIAPVGSGTKPLLCVASQAAGGLLQLSYWRLGPGGAIDLLESDTLFKVNELAISGGVSSLISTRDASGKLRLIHSWGPHSNAGSGRGADIAKVRVDALSSGTDGEWITATISPGPTPVRIGSKGNQGRILINAGILTLVRWKLKDDTIDSDLEPLADEHIEGHAGIAFDAALLCLHNGPVFITAISAVSTFEKLVVKDRGHRHLKLTAWELHRGAIDRLAEAQVDGQYGLLSLARVAAAPGKSAERTGRFLSAMQDEAGNLKIIVWQLE